MILEQIHKGFAEVKVAINEAINQPIIEIWRTEGQGISSSGGQVTNYLNYNITVFEFLCVILPLH